MNTKKKLIIVSLVLVVVLSLLLVNSLPDRLRFTNASASINKITEMITQDSQLTKHEYCIYNDLKYSKGELLCFMDGTIVLDNSSQKNLEEHIGVSAQTAGWTFRGSNSLLINDSNNSYEIANLYGYGKLDCYIREKKVNDRISKLEIGCSGPAKWEWFPVRES